MYSIFKNTSRYTTKSFTKTHTDTYLQNSIVQKQRHVKKAKKGEDCDRFSRAPPFIFFTLNNAVALLPLCLM